MITWHRFLNKCAEKICRRFPPNLNNVSTLPCETWNPHHAGATTALSGKETPEFIPSQLWLPNSPDFDPVDYNVWENCNRRWTKHASLIWTKWNSDWERSGPSWITLSSQHPFVTGVVHSWRSSDACFVHFSCNISHTLLSTGCKSGDAGSHSWAYTTIFCLDLPQRTYHIWGIWYNGGSRILRCAYVGSNLGGAELHAIVQLLLL